MKKWELKISKCSNVKQCLMHITLLGIISIFKIAQASYYSTVGIEQLYVELYKWSYGGGYKGINDGKVRASPCLLIRSVLIKMPCVNKIPSLDHFDWT